jgi:hypothetical protein
VPTITTIASATNICAGSSVTISANGATSYVWTPGGSTSTSIVDTPSIPTAYVVTGVNASGCSSQSTKIVVTTPSPILNVVASDLYLCAGGSSTITASGANTYTWQPSGNTASVEVVSPTTSGIYTVSGTNTLNCSSTATVSIDVFTPSITVTGNTLICAGEETTLTASGANTYSWNTGSIGAATNISPGATSVYTVNTVKTTTGGISCASTTTVQVVVNPTPAVSAVVSRSVICRGESAVITASGASTYSWNGGATGPIIAATSSVITTLLYTVTGTNSQSCSASVEIQVKVNSCNSIDEQRFTNTDLTVLPNPNNGEFVVSSGIAVKLSLVNEIGQLVKVISLSEANNFKCTLSGLASGIYYLTGDHSNGTINKKIIVTR